MSLIHNCKIGLSTSYDICVSYQCSKLRVHPSPGVHSLAAGCTHFDTCAPGECTLFQSISIHYNLYRPVHTETLQGARICVPLHPVCAQNICLISNTGIHLKILVVLIYSEE